MPVTTLVRSRYTAIAAKLESSVGADAIAGSPAPADYVSGDVQVTLNPETIANPVVTGSLDTASPIVGGLKPRLQLRVPLRGSGAAATAPDWDSLMQSCAMKKVAQALAIAPTAATAGSTSSITLATPFAATAQLYRGLPLLLSGNMTVETGITDYSAGRVASLGETLATAPSASTSASIPVNIQYQPVSDDADIKSCTVYIYIDGAHWRFVGCVGSWSLELTTGGIGFLSFDLQAQFAAYSGAAVPGNWVPSTLQPPRFVSGRCQLNRALARSRTLTLNAGVNTVLPDNPEAPQGYDAALPVSRASGGSIDPLTDTVSSFNLFTAFQAGTPMPLMAKIGNTAGNRFLVIMPSIKASGFAPGDRDSLAQDSITFTSDLANAGLLLTAY
jgi:hypothetical protein